MTGRTAGERPDDSGAGRRRGSNLPAVGTYNQTLVLDLIRRVPDGLSRVELAGRTGLSAQTLSNVTRRLADAGLISEAGKVISGPGKPRTLLTLNPTARYAVGVHLDPAVDTYVVVDLAGSVIRHAEYTPRAGAPEVLVAAVAETALELVDRSGIAADRVLGIGVAAPGPLDAEAGRLLDPPLLPSWHHIDVRDRIAAASGLPVTLEKDVTAAVVGELWFDHAEELTDSMFVYYGAGVGVGLAVGGSPLRGRTGNAGNVAHLIVDPDGPPCPCGLRGCLGPSIEPRRLLRDAGLRSGSVSGSGGPGPDVRAELDALSRLAAEGTEAAHRVLIRTADHLARAVTEVNNLLDLDIVVLGGPVWARLSGSLAPRLRERLLANAALTTTRPIELRESRLGTDVAAVGAACLMLDRSFSARPEDLLITP
ncbi:ROK family transcriptional regulator [Nakamurella sp.]|uniref:ROK family transcriptional regulator n=1 Tax=Nakamurella sp. TaxID=1869182 RepID=UPI003B3AA3F9